MFSRPDGSSVDESPGAGSSGGEMNSLIGDELSPLADDEEDVDPELEVRRPAAVRTRGFTSKTFALVAVAAIVVFGVGMETGLIVARETDADADGRLIEEDPTAPGPLPPPSTRPDGATPFQPEGELEAHALNRVRAGLAAVEKARKDMLASFDGDSQILSANEFQGQPGDRVLVDKMAQAMLARRPFVISAAGSSVSAGHDNMGTDAWPRVLGRILRPLWKTFEVDLVLRNQAVGGRNPNPHSLCLAPMLGDDADVVLREWEYWSFYEGFERDRIFKNENEKKWGHSPPRDPTAQMAGLEVFLRMAYMLDNQPAVHLVFLKHAERRGAGELAYLKRWFAPDGPLGSVYGSYGLNAFDCFGKPFDHLRAAAKQPRWQKDVDEATGAKRKCERDSYDNVADCPVDFKKQDGHHEGLLFVNWHPGPLGHATMARQIAYHYMSLMLDAARAIVNGAQGDGGLAAHRKLVEKAAAPRMPLPDNAHCADELCKYKPRCAYSYLPKAQPPDVGDLMVNETASGGQDGANSDTNGKGWVNVLAPNQVECDSEQFRRDRCFAKSQRKTEACRNCLRTRSHLDRKRGFMGAQSDGPITLRSAPGLHLCHVWLCEPPYEWIKSRLTANWRQDVAVKVNGKECSAENGCYSVRQTGYKQCGVVDANAVLGDACRDMQIDVELRVSPKDFPDGACVVKDEDGRQRCDWGSGWEGTDGADECCEMVDGACRVVKGKRTLDEVAAYISEVIAI